MGITKEEVILALKELKDWEGLPYCIEEPMQNEGIAVITKEAFDMAIKLLEQTKWIPVSERLPEGGQDVLFCDIDGNIMIGYHVRGRLDTHFSQQGTYEDIKNVKAWMPLPEEYKAESEDEDGKQEN